MKLTPTCYYNPDEPDTCSICGRSLDYVHIVLDGDVQVPVGVECVKKLRKDNTITGKLPLRGRYDWKLSDVRESAYWSWYGQSIDRSK